jgi:hypothetical protein
MKKYIVFEGRDWTVGALEDLCWTIRVAGGDDDTNTGLTGEVRAEVPPGTLDAAVKPDSMPPGSDPRAGRRLPSLLPAGQRDPLPKPVRIAAQTAGILLALPLVLMLLAYVYGIAIENLF